jgi:hypothetical protein
MEDAAGFFANVFGGEKFKDYVSRYPSPPKAGLIPLQIGEVSLIKEMTSVVTTMMTDEEKADVEKQMNAGPSNGTPKGLSPTPHVDPEADPRKRLSSSCEKPSIDGAQPPTHEQKKRPKPTPEQQKKLDEMEAQRKKDMDERVKTLTRQLIERLRPFVDAQNPGDSNDPETVTFRDKMKKEAEDLKLESFGIEVCLSFLRFGAS